MLLSLLLVPEADAYPFMIRHGYTGCAQCHVDPSGGGALTDYGRAQAVLLLSTQWKEHTEDIGTAQDFLFGAVALPDWLTLQYNARSLVIPEPSNFRWIVMQSDLRAAVDVGPILAYASAGYANTGAEGAWVTSNTGPGGNLVSREYWIGVQPAKGLTIRGGRMALPFGIRSEEHELKARQLTRTDINDSQQVGVDVVYQGKGIRAEAMGILGNYQVSPDEYRERGYSALVAYAPSKNSEVGVSSLVTKAALDVETREDRVRQAHGVFGRYAPFHALVLMGEQDLLLHYSAASADTVGFTGFVQADVEVTQGVHLRGTADYCDTNFADTDPILLTGWATAQWFFTAHADVRIDGLYGTLDCVPGVVAQPMGLAQLHFFL
jgi:hypothetical protein